MRSRLTWIFNCADTFSGNPKWLFLYVVRHRPDIEAVWVTDSQPTVQFVRSLGFRAELLTSRRGKILQQRAGVFVVNQVKERIPDELDGVLLLNLWHGVGVKSIERRLTQGRLQARIARKYIENNKVYHDTMSFLVTSPAMEAHFRAQVGLDEEQLIRGGYPQNIYTRLFGRYSSFDHDLRAQHGLSRDARIAVYAPTYRTEHRGESFLRAAFPDPERLIRVLREANTLLILKMHPSMAKDPGFVHLRERFGDEPNLRFWDNRDDIYEIFGDVDLGIVDYSSIHYDLLAAGVGKFIRYAFDLDDAGVQEHSHDYLSLSAGTLASTFEDLLAALGGDNTVAADERARLADHFWAYDDDDTFTRLVDTALTRSLRDVDLPTLYSFDVFDTVIGRRGIVPVSVFVDIRDRILSAGGQFPPEIARDFVRDRQTAENALREMKRKDPGLRESRAFEIRLADIYRRLAEILDLSADQRDLLMTWEIEAELAATRPLPAEAAHVRALREAGEQVVFLSDMYLPESVVRTLLVKADPSFQDIPLYLSSTAGVQKSTGHLYLHAYHDVGYDHRGWRHTGDNPRADHKAAGALGISTKLLPRLELDTYESALATALGTGDGYRVAGLLHDHRLAASAAGPTSFAFRYVSLFLVPYVLWVLDDAVARGYRTLYFLSRDGHHLKRIADAAIEELGLDLRTRYIFGSRKAWRLASQIDSIDEEFFGEFGTFAGARTVSAMAEIAGLSVAEFSAVIPEATAFAPDVRLSQASQAALRAAMSASATLDAHLLERAAEERRACAAYLEQEMVFDESFAVVEYWGRGYTQECLKRILSAASLSTSTLPFYYARSIYGSDALCARHNFTSSAFSMLPVEAIFANLDHGTVQGYRHAPGGWEPVVEPRQNDADLHDALESELPEFTREFLRLQLTQPARTRRGLFAFAFDHFRTRPAATPYLTHLAPLRDAVELGGEEREFAPALSVSLFFSYLNRDTRASVTRSWPMTFARTTGLPRLLLEAQRRYGFRRKLRAIERRAKPRSDNHPAT
ncbi:hypothetical protein B1729_16280 [Microbacterium sp. B35-04]|uniref:CDP-glycerol glycerophosphotransferase family protein n=1 Tax=Microbacterium sp. B35-04 TaxID=1961716 RepID=UPI0013D6E0A5|nr:CDP-glycerol glycerophosphotransferase family protein [Microbacterium sp. B35-04]KAF2412176.1 hypothetical protein B1729_16280 [Microbacterium sp. B35-04]